MLADLLLKRIARFLRYLQFQSDRSEALMLDRQWKIVDKLMHIANTVYKRFDLGARYHAVLLGTSSQ